MRKFQALEILLIIFIIGAFGITWARNNTIPKEQIPTVINGLVASISMIIGFNGAIMVFILSRRWESLKLGSARPIIYVSLVGIPIVLLWSMYSIFLDGNFDYALKMAMTDLAIASAVLVDFLAYSSRETILHMRENTKKA
jgi:hypothetical protein